MENPEDLDRRLRRTLEPEPVRIARILARATSQRPVRRGPRLLLAAALAVGLAVSLWHLAVPTPDPPMQLTNVGNLVLLSRSGHHTLVGGRGPITERSAGSLIIVQQGASP